jgi:thiol:disulfide interchange protein DsbA
MSLRKVLSTFAATLAFAAAGAWAQAPAPFETLNPPQIPEGGGKIEVIEFFWYGCPHCYALHPHISAWLKRMPKDVSFRYVPAIFRINWTPGAKTFYALEALGARDRLHNEVYDAIHIGKIDLTKDEVLFD